MRKLGIIAVLSLMALALAAVPALAAKAHFKPGSPQFTQASDTTLDASGYLAGLGNYTTLVQVDATGTPDVTCTSPGGNESPGQNPGSVDVSGAQTIPATDVKNGNIFFDVVTEEPGAITGKQGGCPNNNWSATINSIDFTSATVYVYQDFNGDGTFSANELVLKKTYTL